MASGGHWAALDLNGVAVAYLEGVTLRKAQDTAHYHHMGTVRARHIFRGPIRETGSFRRAFTDTGLAGTLNLGTYDILGTIYPTGAATPYAMGTFVLKSLNWLNMATGSLDAVQEEFEFDLINVTYG